MLSESIMSILVIIYCFIQVIQRGLSLPCSTESPFSAEIPPECTSYQSFLHRQAFLLGLDFHHGHWDHYNIFTDEESAEHIGGLVGAIADQDDVRITVTTRTDRRQFKLIQDRGMFNVDKTQETQLNLVICNSTCVQRTVKQILRLLSGCFLFHSKWLIITDVFHLNISTSGFEHIAVITPKVSGKCDCHVETLLISGDDQTFHTVSNTYLCQNIVNFISNEWNSHLMITRDPLNASVVTYTGLSFDIIMELQKILKFKINYIHPPDNITKKWVYFYEMLRNQEIDLLAAPVVRTTERSKLMDFPFAYNFDGVAIIYRKTPTNDSRARLVGDVISWPVTLLTLLALMLTAVCLLGSRVVNGQSLAAWRRVETRDSFRSHLQLLPLYIFDLFGNIFRQGNRVIYSHPGSGCSTRLFLSTWQVFCLILTVSFSAHLVSLLGVIKPKLLFSNLHELINNNQGFKWGTYGDGSWLYDTLEKSSIESYKKLFTQMMEFYELDPTVISHKEEVHVNNIEKGNYAYFTTTQTARLLSQNRCDLHIIDGHFFIPPSTMPTAKNSPYTKIISDKLILLFENGQIENLFKKWFPEKRGCVPARPSTSSISLVYLQSAFTLLVSGVSSATVILIAEKIYSKYYRKVKYRTD